MSPAQDSWFTRETPYLNMPPRRGGKNRPSASKQGKVSRVGYESEGGGGDRRVGGKTGLKGEGCITVIYSPH